MLGAHKSQEDLEGIGQIDYLIVPVGDEGSFVPWKILKKLIKKIDPAYVVPCCYKEKGLSDELGEIKTLDDFVSEFGVGKVQEKTTLKMSSVSRSDEDEQYKIVTLKRR
jgi:L-ascorbate metabolism protein UlaG (beta-lactamase superfamily)